MVTDPLEKAQKMDCPYISCCYTYELERNTETVHNFLRE